MNKNTETEQSGRSGVACSEWLDDRLILGALDSLGVALAGHHHQWTTGERAIYEEAVTILTSRADCTDSDLSASGKLQPLKPCLKRRQEFCRASIQLLASEYSLWRVALVVGHLAVSNVFRCCGSIYSYSVRSSNAQPSGAARKDQDHGN